MYLCTTWYLSLSLAWMCAQWHITFIHLGSYGAFLAPYTLPLSLLPRYKYTNCMCSVAHPTFATFARFSAYGRKSSRQREENREQSRATSRKPSYCATQPRKAAQQCRTTNPRKAAKSRAIKPQTTAERSHEQTHNKDVKRT